MIGLNRILGKPSFNRKVMKKLVQHGLGVKKEKAEDEKTSAQMDSLFSLFLSLETGMAKAALLSLSGWKIVHFFPYRPKNTGDDHLGDPISHPDRKRLFPKIDQDNAYLSPVIGIDRPRAIHHSDSISEGQSASRPDLAFKSLRNGDRNSRGNKPSLAGL